MHSLTVGATVALVSTLLPLATFLLLEADQASWLTAVAALGSLAISLGAIWLTRCEAVILFADKIERRTAFGARSLPRDQIEGWRDVQGSPILISREGARSVTLPSWAVKSAALREWISGIPNLDRAAYEAAWAEALSDRRLGDTKAERERTIHGAHLIARLAAWLSMGLFVWIAAFPIFYPYAVSAGFLAPVVALVAVVVDPRRFSLLPTNALPLPASLLGLLMVGGSLGMRAMHDVSLVSWWPSVATGVVVAAVVTFSISRIDSSTRHPLAAALIAPFLFGWIWGALVLGNSWGDPSGVLSPLRVETTTAYGTLIGVTSDGRRHEMDAPDGVLLSARQGVQVCILERDGRLGWKHRGLYTCPGLTSEVVASP